MPMNEDDLRQILLTGRESLNTELKPWFPPGEDRGTCIIAKACMALRNAGGGSLVIGMDDSGQPDNRDHIQNIRATFHQDAVQEIVARYSSEQFEITVHFVDFSGMERVVVEVPSGVRTPVVCRNNLPRLATPGGQPVGSLLQEGITYVRTLAANGRPSTSAARPSDWPRLMETCFNNREADVGAFMRRQLSGIDIQSVSSTLSQMLNLANAPTPTEAVDAFMNESHEKFLVYKSKTTAPDVGYREVAAVITGDFTEPAMDQQYLWTIGNTPDRSGWPPFFTVTNFNVNGAQMKWDDDGAEAFIYNTELFHIIDFSRIESSGRFCFVEGYHDDLSEQIRPNQQLDFTIQASRLADTFAKMLHFAKAFCGADSNAVLTLAIRWRGLLNRRLTSWADPMRSFVTRDISQQDEVITHISIPVACAIEALGDYTETVISRLTRVFGGWQFDRGVIRQIVDERLGVRRP